MSAATPELRQAAGVVGTASRAVVFSGAGVSAESGIPTYRGQDGLWRRYDPYQVASIERFRADARAQIERGARMLDDETPGPSDAWLELAEALRRSCWRVASASHCLYEWEEPEDARADVDEREDPADRALDSAARARRRARRAGRRNIKLWSDNCGV